MRTRFYLKIVSTVGAVALLLVSWLVLFRSIELLTEFLVPYNTTWYDYVGWPANSPPAGSWQRNLNYFFEVPPGSLIPAVLSTGVSIGLLGLALARTPRLLKAFVPLALSFALSNLIIVAGMFGALFAGPHLERAGYGWTVGRLMPNLLLLAALLILQARVIPSRFRSALNLHPKEPAHKRDAPS